MQWDAGLYESAHDFVWKAAASLIDVLQPQPHETILDVGCGTGQLTAKIAECGAQGIGLDSSPPMIGQARQNYPKLKFMLADARDFTLAEPVDAVFSNAALHWIRDADAVAACIARALKRGGRFVAELGGKGNIAQILAALEPVLNERNLPSDAGYYFPGIAEYSSVLERHGLEVRSALLFDRDTPLEGEQGMRSWLTMFNGHLLPEEHRYEIVAEVEERLRPTHYRDQQWRADYRRLRITAIKR
jgi:trans-aconitate methyltransferase